MLPAQHISGRKCDTWLGSTNRNSSLGHSQDAHFGGPVSIAFADEVRPGYFAIVNADMKLGELGWIKFPKLMHLGWAAQWLNYEARLKAQLARPALDVPIFKEAVRCWLLLVSSQPASALCVLKAQLTRPALEVPVFKEALRCWLAIVT